MVKVKVFDLDNNMEKEFIEIDDKFLEMVRKPLIYQAAMRQRANLRQVSAHTKTRGEVRGGGRKPWRQKGLGRARAGSIRSPIWIGGGIVFGPRKNRNFKKRMPQKSIKAAIKDLLADKIKNNKLILVENLRLELPKTKLMIGVLAKLGVAGKVLVVLEQSDPILESATRNIIFCKVIKGSQLNILDLLNYDFVIMTKNTFKKLESFEIKRGRIKKLPKKTGVSKRKSKK